MTSLADQQKLFKALGGDQDALLELLQEIPSEYLPAREKRILIARYCEDKSLAEVGQEYDIKKSRVSQLEARAFRRLRFYGEAKVNGED